MSTPDIDLRVEDRLPPQNIDAEETILGGMMMDPEAITRVTEYLKPDAFYVDSHKEIFKAALSLHSLGRPTDLLSLMNWLEDHKLIDKVGGNAYLRRLTDAATNTINIDAYAQLVAEKHSRRQLIRAGQEIVSLGYDTATEIPKVMDAAEQKLFGVTQARVDRSLVAASEVLMNIFEQLESRFEQGDNIFGIPTNFYDLDNYTQGLQPSDLIVVAGRPAMGKCCAKQTPIVDPATGELRTIEEIYRLGQAGKAIEVFSLLADWRLARVQPSHFVDDGIKPVFKVKTRLGREVETTATHPFLTAHGWRPLSQLEPGTRIAVPRQLPVFGKEALPEEAVISMAALVGEGAEEQLPRAIFCLPKEQVALFLNRLFTTGGSVCSNRLKGVSYGRIVYYSGSKQLCRDIQHLLLRFGILACLQEKKLSCKNERRAAYLLEIAGAADMLRFADRIGSFTQEKAFKTLVALTRSRVPDWTNDRLPIEVWDLVSAEKGELTWREISLRSGKPLNHHWHAHRCAPRRETIATIASAIHSDLLAALAHSDIYWDEITAIDYSGLEQVYDLTVPTTHNFVAADICLHNTAFALSIAKQVAEKAGLPAVVFSLEMSKEQLVQRLLCSEAEVESHRLRAARISENEWQRVGQAIGRLASMPLYIDDTPNATVTEIRSKARRLQAEQGGRLGLIMIDYLQLMEGSGSENRVQEISRITRGLKGLARELHVPIIALSQLSRGVETRTNKRPMLSDLRESGSIEQDADIVIMLYRDDYYNPDSPDRNIAEAIIVKHRNGPTGTVRLLFESQYTRFMNLSAGNY